MYKLTFTKGSLKGHSLEVTERKVIFGRDVACQVQLTDEGVSRQHCYIEERSDGLYICDMASTNGVYVNGKKIAQHRLIPNDHIKIGGVEFVFEPRKQAEPAAPPKPPAPPPKPEPPPAPPTPSKPPAEKARAPAHGAAVVEATPWSSYVALILAVLAVLGILLLAAWAWRIEHQVRSLQEQMPKSNRPPATESAPVPKAFPRGTSQSLPSAPRAEDKRNSASSRLRIVQREVDRQFDDEAIDERVLVKVKVRPQMGGEYFDASQACVLITFFEKVNGTNIEESKFVEPKVVRCDKSWSDGIPQSVTAAYVLPKNVRVQEKVEAGRSRHFFGFIVRTYYQGELQDMTVFPDDFPKALAEHMATAPLTEQNLR